MIELRSAWYSSTLFGSIARATEIPVATAQDVRRDHLLVSEARRLPADGLGRHFPRSLSRGFFEAERDRAGQGARIPHPVAAAEPHVPAGSPHHGADPVELVPALRPESADLRAEHPVRAAGELRQGDAARLAHGGTILRDRAAGHRAELREERVTARVALPVVLPSGAGSGWPAQVTRGFQSANVPSGLFRQAHTWIS